MKNKKLLALILTAAVAVSALAGCGSGSGSSDDSDSSGSSSSGTVVSESGDDTIVVNCNDGDPGTLDPFAASSSARKVCLMQIYDRLVEYDEDGNYVGVLAKEWSQEGNIVTLELYDYITDTDGNAFTASDVKYSIEMAAAGGNTSALVFDDIEVVDDYNLIFTLNSTAVATFESNAVLLYMVTEAAYEASGENMALNPVATGAYKVESYETGSSVKLTKNEDYWQEESLCTALIQQQNIENIEYNLMTESSQIIVGLESGEIDAAMTDFNQSARFDEGGDSYGTGIVNEIIDTWGGNALFFNCSDQSYFADNVALRKAILYAIDREGIIEGVFEGNAMNPVCYGNINYPDANPEWADQDYFNYDLEKAQEYFAESGYSEGEITLRLIYPQSSYCDNCADLIQAYLSVIGINVEINALEAAIYSEYIKDETQWDIALIGKGGSGTITTVWNSTLNRDNYSGDGSYCAGFINDDTLQELVETAADVSTNSIETCDAVQQYLNEMAYNMQVYVEQKCVTYNSNKIESVCTNVDARWVPGASVLK